MSDSDQLTILIAGLGKPWRWQIARASPPSCQHHLPDPKCQATTYHFNFQHLGIKFRLLFNVLCMHRPMSCWHRNPRIAVLKKIVAKLRGLEDNLPKTALESTDSMALDAEGLEEMSHMDTIMHICQIISINLYMHQCAPVCGPMKGRVLNL